MKHTLKEWIIATRPWSFTASASPVIIILAWLYGNDQPVNWFMGLWTLFTVIIVHAAGNVWSDYFDYKKKVDTDDTFGAKFLTSGQFQPSETLRLSIVLNIVAILSGIAIWITTGIISLWLGIAGVALSLLYPYLKYHALGDVVIFLCYTLLPALATTYIVTGQLIWGSLIPTVASGLITIAILHANNTRDIQTDHRAGIYTLPILTGIRTSVAIYLAEIILPYAWVIGLCACRLMHPWTLLVILSLPLAINNLRKVTLTYTERATLPPDGDTSTAQLQMVFSVLLTAGLALA